MSFVEEMKAKEGEFPGFDIKKFEIMEASLVSVPSNIDAQTEDVMMSLLDSGKLHSPLKYFPLKKTFQKP